MKILWGAPLSSHWQLMLYWKCSLKDPTCLSRSFASARWRILVWDFHSPGWHPAWGTLWLVILVVSSLATQRRLWTEKFFQLTTTESRQKLDNSTNVGKTRPRDKMKHGVKTFVDNTKDNIEKFQTCKFWINSQSFPFFSKEFQNWLRVSQVE